MTDLELARAHAPVLLFDRHEPFLPSRAGYSVFREPADSAADYRRTADGDAPIRFDLPGLEAVVEYGIWWDWDIQHLYELEAAWVYVGAGGSVLRVEASWHSRFHEMTMEGAPPLRGGRPLLHSQPGKHAFAPDPGWFTPRERYTAPCREGAGDSGLLLSPLFKGEILKEPGDDERVAAYLRRFAFTPAFVFDREFPIEQELLCPWAELRTWIPGRVREIARSLRECQGSGPVGKNESIGEREL